MDNPRPEKVAVVDEVRERFDGADAALLTEYRGLNVGELAELRRSLRDAGGEYKIYKNTLVRFAARDLGLEIDDLLTGPDRHRLRRRRRRRAWPRRCATSPGPTRRWSSRAACSATKRCSAADDAGRWPTSPPREVLLAQLAGGHGRADAAVRRPAPGRCPATSPTASRP